MSNGKATGPDKNSDTKSALALMGITEAEVTAAPAGVHLSEQQAAFVDCFIETGNRSEAALMAGITDPKEIRSMMANPNVVAAIKLGSVAEVLSNVVAGDAAVRRVLNGSDYTGREKIAAAKVAFERAGVLKAAELNAEKAAATTESLSRLSEGDLERVIADAAARIAARKPGDRVVLDADTGQPVADEGGQGAEPA
jgi:hypothetical protein